MTRFFLVRLLPALFLGLASGAVIANFTNGDFETGDFSSWTKATFLNNGLTGTPPFDGADIVRTPGGVDTSAVLGSAGGGPESQTDPYTPLKFPKFGNYCARVSGPVSNYNSNVLSQQTVLGAGDVDPVDGKVHVRIAIAPVLQNPGHPADEQPFFYVGIKNVSRGNALLYQTLNFSAEPGVPWITIGSVQYTTWQFIDIAPGAGQLDAGDTVEIEIIGAGCAQSGHWGYVYVDSASTAGLPGLTIEKTANKTLAYPGDTITYNFTYRNGGTAAASAVVVKETIPAGTTFTSVSDTTNCSEAAGVVTCNFASLAAGASGTFSVTVTVDAGATGTITNGNYTIEATGVSPTLGPVVRVPLAGPPTDVAILKTVSPGNVSPGADFTYTLVVTNNGPATAQGVYVTDVIPASLQLISATPTQGICTGVSTVTCQLNDIAVSGTVTVTIVARAQTAGAVLNTATVAGNFTDTNSANDASTAQSSVGAPPVPALSTYGFAAFALALAAAGFFALRRLVI
jgi:uncharacterized repeat protein (TIGR01451 family)